jgi:hypothetical protein
MPRMRTPVMLLIVSSCAAAQSITGALAGFVTDPTDASIPKASVLLRHNATGAERPAETNEAGRFFFGSLQPGAYTLTIEAAGFRRLERTNVNVPAAETVSLSA